MIPVFLLALPIVVACVTLFLRGEEKRLLRRWLFFLTTVFHAMGTGLLFFHRQESFLSRFIAVDSLGLLFLAVTSCLFVAVAVYSFGYFYGKRRSDAGEGVSHFYIPAMLLFLAAATLTSLAQHLGLLWVAIEATTLATAPLIYYHHHPRALEATWKYLLICSVGIALALLGIFFVAASGQGLGSDLFLATLIAKAPLLEARWLHFALILVFVGFGTKMGLAPFHTWLPDAHSEAPSPVSALLSGALLNCAFLAILRFWQIAVAGGLGPFMTKLFIIFGLTSLFVAAVFILRQRDYKRLLAYSSIEHMGILSLAVGVGAPFAGLLHVVNHSLTKGLLFLTAGQILGAYRSKNIADVHGLLKTLPVVGWLFLIGFLAIVGSPPFGPFVSEFLILRAGLANEFGVVMIFYLFLLGIIFVPCARIFLQMVQGEKRELPQNAEKPTWPMIVPTVVLAVAVTVLGLYLPPPLQHFLEEAARLLQEIP